MFRLSRPLAPALAVIALCLSITPAAAQWIASGRWGSESNWRYIVPGTWMVQRHDNPAQPVSIHAEGANHVGRIALWCDPTAQTSALRFDAYRGSALRQPAATPDTTEAATITEPVIFEIDGQAFQRSLTYDATQRLWTATDVLDAAFLDAFSWGTRLNLRNAAGEDITGYLLSGSSSAREALRRACQF